MFECLQYNEKMFGDNVMNIGIKANLIFLNWSRYNFFTKILVFLSDYIKLRNLFYSLSKPLQDSKNFDMMWSYWIYLASARFISFKFIFIWSIHILFINRKVDTNTQIRLDIYSFHISDMIFSCIPITFHTAHVSTFWHLLRVHISKHFPIACRSCIGC